MIKAGHMNDANFILSPVQRDFLVNRLDALADMPHVLGIEQPVGRT
jgi:hypothetical protein